MRTLAAPLLCSLLLASTIGFSAAAGADDHPLNVVMFSGSSEYKSDNTESGQFVTSQRSRNCWRKNTAARAR